MEKVRTSHSNKNISSPSTLQKIYKKRIRNYVAARLYRNQINDFISFETKTHFQLILFASKIHFQISCLCIKMVTH